MVYLQARGGRSWSDDVNISALLVKVADAVRTLDLIAFLPIASPDPTGGGGVEQPTLHRRVDRRPKATLCDDALAMFGDDRPRLLELAGSRTARLRAPVRVVGP